jgi:hypothetical protein
MIKKTTLSFLGILIFQLSFSQKNYLPGYLISLNGDTIKGFVDYRGWETNPNKIDFRSANNEDKSYTPSRIKGFGVADEIYESAIVKTEIGATSVLEFKNDSTFLRTVFQGGKSLYFYKDKDQGRGRFYIKDNSTYELLLYKTYPKEQDDGGFSVQVENKKYIGQLLVYLKDCPNIQRKLNQLVYTKRGMEKLFLYYYECTHSKISFQKKEKIDLEFGAVAGISITSLKFSGDPNYGDLINTNYQSPLNFSGGLFLNVVMPGNQKKLALYNELLYSSFEANGQSKDVVNLNQYTVTSSKFGNTVLKINNLVRYKYPVGKAFLFFNGGLSSGFVISETNYKRAAYTFYSSTTVTDGDAMVSPKKFEIGFVGGLGVSLNKYCLDLRMEKSSGFSPYLNLHENITRYYFLLGYRF